MYNFSICISTLDISVYGHISGKLELQVQNSLADHCWNFPVSKQHYNCACMLYQQTQTSR